MDGTLDVWLLAAVTALNLFSAAWGIKRLGVKGAFDRWNAESSENVLWLAIVFAFADAVPGCASGRSV